MKAALILGLLLTTISLCESKDPWKQPHGLVPDKEAAIKIAEAIVFPLYGVDMVVRQRPYRVYLQDGFWHVIGTMPEKDAPEFGGTFFIVFSQWDARVIYIGHDE